MSPKYRFRSVACLLAEIRDLYTACPFGHLQFLDANFFVNVRRTLDFARTLYHWNPDITWSATATADSIAAHADVIHEIGRLNCVSLEVGIENGSAATLARFNKRTTLDHNLRAIALLEGSGIDLDLDYILFDSETTPEDLYANLAFLQQAELTGYYPNDHLFNGVRLYPGTAARARYQARTGMTDDELDRNLTPRFFNDKTDAIYRIISGFFRFRQKFLTRVLLALDHESHTLRSLNTNQRADIATLVQRMTVAVIHLKHAPQHFFEEVLDAIVEGRLQLGATFDDATVLPSVRALENWLQIADGLLEEARSQRELVNAYVS